MTWRTPLFGAVALAALGTGCSSKFIMEGESIETLGKQDHIGVITDGKAGGYMQRAVESNLMAKGVKVQAVSIEEFKNDLYKRRDYDHETNGNRIAKELKIEATSYDNIATLQGINDYTVRRDLAADALGLLKDLNSDWDLDYILVVREGGAYAYNVYMIDTASRERVFSLFIETDKKGWMANFPTPRNTPSIAKDRDLGDADIARMDMARYLAAVLTSKSR